MSNAFDIMDVPYKAALSKQMLTDAYAKKRKQATTEEACAHINAAFKVLRDPIARAELILSLKKVTLDPMDDLPPDTLMHFFERQESLDLLEDSALPQNLRELRAELLHVLRAIDAADTPESLKNAVLQARYTYRLVTSLTRRLDAQL